MFPKIPKLKKTVYLDHAATTPLAKEVMLAMEPFLNDKFGNPSSLYQKGREAKEAIETARKSVAKLISARPSEIIFTSGGTESVNLAILGFAKTTRGHFITSTIEHHCVINSYKALESWGYKTSYIDVDDNGFINFEKLKKSVRPETVFISIMLANNEIGTIEPVAEIGKWFTRINAERMKKGLKRIIFHTDACQAPGFLDLDVNKLGVDLMSVNGSKIYGPKQVGFLYVRLGTKIEPLIYGGGQERGLRSGTENVAGIVGFAKAFELAQKSKDKESKRLLNLSGRLYREIKKNIPGVQLNGPDFDIHKTPGRENNQSKRLPNNINITIKDLEGESLMFYLDSYGICASTASACSTGTTEPSHVLLAVGKTPKEAKSSIRFTLGKSTNSKEINYLIKLLPQLVKELRKIK